MDEELQKRNTDCVYFLASPLTCKKGLECEYRHSEIARLNPRDCWYWVAGSCLNPTCTFRHPPLDGGTEESSDPVTTKTQCSAPVNKTNVPCYFYFNGFCNKGDRCSFLHGPEDNAPALKSAKSATGVTDALPLENKTSAGTDVGSFPTERLPNSCENAPKRAVELQTKPKNALALDNKTSAWNGIGSVPTETPPNSCENVPKRAVLLQTKPKDDLHESSPSNVVEGSASPHISSSECEEAALVRSDDILLPVEGYNESRSLIFSDQSSEEQEDGFVGREEWLESSPGFDVLVDDGSEKLGYEEDDPEYLLAINGGEGRELNGHFLGYDYEDHVEYDPAYAEARILYEQDVHDTYDHLDNEPPDHYVREMRGRSRERVSDPRFPCKRKFFMPAQSSFDGRRSVDLRDHLKNSRMADGRALNHFLRRRDLSRLIGGSRGGSRGQRSGRAHGRMSSEVENSRVGSHGRNEVILNGGSQSSRLRNSHINRSRERRREKRRFQHHTLSSEVSRRPAAKKRRSSEEYAMFSGPKSLAEIKEEKQKARENGELFRRTTHSSRTTSEDFQGPKPLSEILIAKGSQVHDLI